jgi:2-polyprenyl-6-hydroxyphenyl methylase/3-demethylubiquinone-9 3-methyltransferase
MEPELSKVEQDRKIVNNQLYDDLLDRWYDAQDDPVALLRSQHELLVPWIKQEIRKNIGYHGRVLDLGCGAGLLTNQVAQAGYQVTGIDISGSSLKVAKERDMTKSVDYVEGDVYKLPFKNHSFDVVIATDLLEHVSDPRQVVSEASRVLQPGGLFFFHTFSKNPLAWAFVIEGMKFFVRNTPDHLHVYSLFISPKDLKRILKDCGLSDIPELRGMRPVIAHKAFWKMVFTGIVPKDFKFKFTKRPLITYAGYAKKSRDY